MNAHNRFAKTLLFIASFCTVVQPALANFQFQVPLEPQSTGAAGGGQLAYSESTWDFGAVGVTKSAAHTFHITNTGTSSISFSSIAVSGDDFSRSTTCGAYLAPQASCDVTATLAPSASGGKTGAITVTSDDVVPTATLALSGRGQAGTLSATGYTFPDPRQVGSDLVYRDIVVTNMADAPVRVAGITVASGASDFSQSNTCGANIAAGSSCTVRVGFAPAASGTREGVVAVTSDSDNSPLVIAVAGEGRLPSGTLAAQSFGQVQVGIKATRAVQLANTGVDTLTLSAPALSGDDYTIASSTCSATLAAGTTCTTQVALTPTQAGARSGGLSFTSNAGTLATSFDGVGVDPAADITSAAFGDVLVGTTQDATVSLTNKGIDVISVEAPQVTGTGFSLKSTTCQTTLAGGASCDIVVTAAPTSAASLTGNVSVVTGAGTKTGSVSARGTQGVLTLAPAAIPDFGNVQVGQAKVSMVLSVSNSGTAPIAGMAMALPTGYTSSTSTCGATLGVSQSCTFTVTFSPVAVKSYTGNLTVTADAPVTTLSVPVTGAGVGQSATTTDLSFGSVQANATKDLSATLTNAGVGPLSVTAPTAASVSGANFSFIASDCASSLAVGASCHVTVRFAPVASANYTGSVALVTGAGTKTVALSGTGIQGNASASPTSLDFGTIQLGNTANSQSVVVTNNGTSTLTINGVSVAAGAANYAQTNGCGSPLAVGASCTINVTFTPSAATSQPGSLAIAHDGSGVTSVSLSGRGQAASATLSAVDFGSVVVGQSSTLTSTLTNTGVASITVTPPTAASVTGTDLSFVSTTCGSTLGAGATCTASVKFSPTAASSRTGSLSFATGAGTMTASLSGTGLRGNASLSASNLPFAAQQVDTSSASQTVTLTNTGNTVLAVSKVQVTAGSTDYAATSTCASVAVNGTCTVTVTFTPSTTGSLPGTVTLTHDGTGATSFTMSGTGQAQSASLSTPSFASTPVGSNSTATATLSNTGIGALAVTTPTAASVSGTGFSFVSTTCGTSVAVSGSCTVTVRFSPTSTSAASGTLTIATGAGTKTATLGSTGIQGYATISPGSLTFAAQQVGSTSAVQTVTVTNTGTDVLTFTGVSISSGASDFAQSNNCGAVAVNGTCTVNVSFTPAAVTNPRAGTLTFVHNGGGLASVSLTGTAQAASATLSNVSFGNVSVSASSTLTATLQNTGIGSISVTTPTAASVSGTDFSFVSTTCGTTLAANGTCTVSVKLTPTAKTSRTGSLSFATGAGSMTSTLSGAGIQGTASYSASSLTYLAQQVGTTSATQTVTVTNTGNDALSISGVSFGSGASDFGQSNTCGSAIAVNGTCTITVAFTPAASGTRPGSLTVANNGSGGNGSITLTGTGQASSATITSANWPQTQVGSTTAAGQTYQVVTNTGIGPISLTGTPTVNSPFTYVSNDCGSSLAAGATCKIQMSFTPPAAQTYTQTLTVPTSAGTLTSTSVGVGVAASLVVTTNGNLGTNLTPMTISGWHQIFQNNGIGNVTITGAPTVSGGTISYVVGGVNPYCYNGLVMAPGATCVVWTQIQQPAGTYSGTLSLPSTAGTTSIAVSGTVVGTISASAAAFGDVAAGSTKDMTVTVSNTAAWTSRNMAYSATAPFSIVANNCGTTLAANSSCTMTVRYSPTGTTTVNGNYVTVTGAYARIRDPGVEETQYIGSTITAYGVMSGRSTQAVLSLSPSSKAFGNVQVGQTSGTQTVTITNTGNITATGLAGSVSTGFNLAAGPTPCGTSIAAGGSCSVNLSFSPTSATSYSSNYVITGSNIATINMALTGTGTNPSIVLDHVNPSASGWVMPAYSSSRFGVYLRNNGNGPVTINSATTSTGGVYVDSSAASCGPGNVVAAGATCWLLPGWGGVGAQSMTLSVATSAGTVSTTLSATEKTLDMSVTGNGASTASTADMTVKITNNTAGNFQFASPYLNLLSASGTGSWAVVSNGCPVTLAANGGTCNIVVRYTSGNAASAGSVAAYAYGTFEFQDMLDGAVLTGSGRYRGTDNVAGVTLSATSLRSVATLTANANFGTVWYQAGSNQAVVTVRNDGNTAMTLTPSGYSAPFSLVSNGCSGVAVGSSCNITFSENWQTASSSSTYSQNITLTGGGTGAITANLYGVIMTAVPRWSTTSLAFGGVVIGSSSTQAVTVTNIGNVTYSWSPYPPAAQNGFTFDTSNCVNVAPNGGTCTVNVTFTPPAATSYTASNVVMSSTAYSWIDNYISATGTGLNPPFTPSTGTATPTATFTYTNSSGASRTITGVTLGASDSTKVAFSITSNSCTTNSVINNGGSCSITVTGSRNGIACSLGTAPLTLSTNGGSYTVYVKYTNASAC